MLPVVISAGLVFSFFFSHLLFSLAPSNPGSAFLFETPAVAALLQKTSML